MRVVRMIFTGVLFAAASCCAQADSLFTFTLTGDGHTFQFTTPNPPTITDHPHIVQVSVDDLEGTVDGVGGYTFNALVVVELNFGFEPTLMLNVSPLPAGQQSQGPFGPNYDLNGPSITTLVSDVPNPYPECYFSNVCNDLLTFAFVPGNYAFIGYDPNRTIGDYTLEIAPAQASAVTPEPSAWLLVLTGASAAGMTLPPRKRLCPGS